MSENIRQLESLVEHEMMIFSDLVDTPPESAVVARMKASVLAESRRCRQSRQASRLRRISGAVAAMILLAIAIQWPSSTSASAEEADAYISNWIVYSGESTEYLTALFDDPADTEFDWDDEGSMDTFLDGMESTLGQDS